MTIKSVLFLLLPASLFVLANFAPPPTGPCDSPVVGGHTGAPGESSCTGCHGGTANTGLGSLQLVLNDTTLRYTPGETFDALVTMRQAGRDKFGFVALALKDAGNTTIGTFSIDDAMRTRTYSDGARKYVSHTPCGADAVPPDSLSWTFHWKAPTTNVGNITLYLAGLVANHNHALSGDDTYTLVVHLLPDSTSSVGNIPVSHRRLDLWPNPTSEVLHFEMEAGFNSAEIWSADGRLRSVTTLTQNQLSVLQLEPGVYFLRLKGDEGLIIGQAAFVKI